MTREERIERTFVTSEAPRLSVSNARGSVRVQCGEREDVQVTAVKRPDEGGDPERTTIEISQDGDRITVKTRYEKERDRLFRLNRARPCRVDYVVRAPARCNVHVNQVKGTIHVSGVTGRVKVNAVQGTVELRDIIGRTQVQAVSATVAGRGWQGRARLHTVSGTVEVDAAQLSRVKAHTVSGDLSLETALADEGYYDFHSVSGDVTLHLAPGVGLQSRGSTLSGRLRCALPHEFTRRGRGGWQATVNGGGPPLRFSSVSGDLEIQESGRVARS